MSRPSPADGVWIIQAERILTELEQETQRAFEALETADAAEVLDAVESRGRALSELDDSIDELARRDVGLKVPPVSEASRRWFADASAQALAAHHDLLARVAASRDRLRDSVAALDRPDRVAARYTNGSRTAPTISLSV